MDDYIDKVLTGFPKEIFESAPSPAGDHLFKIGDEDEEKVLPEEQCNMYQHVVAQLLFVAFCVRQDIHTTVVFLTTCVKAPDKDDWGKVMKYLKGGASKKYTTSRLSWYHQVVGGCSICIIP